MGIFGFGSKEVLYFPGCFSSAFLKDKIENYRKIMKKLGIDFDMNSDNSDFVCCGGFLDENGYEKQLRKISKENLSYLENKKTKKIITNCPLCYNTLKNYKEMLPNWNIDVELTLSVIAEKLRANEDLFKTYSSEPVAYYDSCYLARYSGVTEQPREILKMIGHQIIELPQNKEETLCCGSCGGLMHTNKELADEIAVRFIKMLIRKSIKKIVTADSRAYYHLKENLEKLKIDREELELLELSDVLCDALGISRED